MYIEKSGFLYERYSELDSRDKFSMYNEVFVFLRKLLFEYPNFYDWYNALFDSTYDMKKTREMIICRKEKVVVGIIILKKTQDENKICTIRVDRNYRNRGIATNLVELGLEWLEDDKPLVTCHWSKSKQYERIFDYFGFELAEKKLGYYGFFNLEYVFNGSLPEKAFGPTKIELIDMSKVVEYAVEHGIYDPRMMVDMCVNLWREREEQLVNYVQREENIIYV